MRVVFPQFGCHNFEQEFPSALDAFIAAKTGYFDMIIFEISISIRSPTIEAVIVNVSGLRRLISKQM